MSYLREPDATIEDLREHLESLAVLAVGSANPGIDLEQVKQERSTRGHSWTALQVEEALE